MGYAIKQNVSKAIIAFLTLMLVFFIFRYVRYSACFAEENIVKLPIIMYHNISDKSSKLGKYTILDKQFENDIKFIKDNGYTTITMSQLIDYVYNGTALPEKSIIITFDDGYESFYAYAYPILKKYEMCAVMSIVGKYTDMFTEEEDHNLDYSHLNWNQVKELNESGYVEIQNHTYNMHEITKTRRGCGIKKGESLEEYRNELFEDIGKLQTQLSEYIDFTPNTFAYPYGHISPESIDFIKEMGFKAAFTCTEQVNEIDRNPETLFHLCRFNRANGKSSSDFFSKIFEKVG